MSEEKNESKKCQKGSIQSTIIKFKGFLESDMPNLIRISKFLKFSKRFWYVRPRVRLELRPREILSKITFTIGYTTYITSII